MRLAGRTDKGVKKQLEQVAELRAELGPPPYPVANRSFMTVLRSEWRLCPDSEDGYYM